MWSNEQMTPESSVSQYNLPCEQMFETSLTGEPDPIRRPALAGRCGPFPTGANRESPSGHRERSRPHGAPPLRRAPPPQSWSPVDPAAGPEPGCAHRHGRRPPPRVARTPVHAQRPPPLQLSSSPGTKANNPGNMEWRPDLTDRTPHSYWTIPKPTRISTEQKYSRVDSLRQASSKPTGSVSQQSWSSLLGRFQVVGNHTQGLGNTQT